MGRPGFDRAQMLTRVAAQRGTAISNLGVQPEVVWTVSESILVTRIPGCGTTIRDPHASDAVITIPSGTTSIFTPWSFTGCAYTATVFDSPGATVTEMEFGSDRGPIDLGYNPDGSFTIEANVVIQPDFVWQGIVVKESPRNYGLWVTPSTWPSAGTLHFSYHPVGSSSLCPFYGNTRIDDGLPHHVAVRFDRRVGSTPLVSFFVDGVLDGEQFGCTTTAPLAGGGSGANILRIGSLFRPGSLVGNVRLFHRYVEDDEISFHVSTGAT